MKEYYYNQDEIDLVVKYEFDPGEASTYDYPGSGFILSIIKVYVDTDLSKSDISDILAPKIQEIIENEIVEHEQNSSYADIYEDYSDDRT
jgi:hypothetical protein